MLAEAKGVFGERWPKVKDYTESEYEKLTITLTQISKLKLKKQISDGEASILFEMQKNTARAVMSK